MRSLKFQSYFNQKKVLQKLKENQLDEAQSILKSRLPSGIMLYNAIQLSKACKLNNKNGDTEFDIYTLKGELNEESLIFGISNVRLTLEEEPNVPVLFLSAPVSTPLSKEQSSQIAEIFEKDPNEPHKKLSFIIERSISPSVVQSLLNRGYIINIRSCDIYVIKDPKNNENLQKILSVGDTYENYELRDLDVDEHSETVAKYYSYGHWDHPLGFIRTLIKSGPSTGVFNKINNELVGWTTYYIYGCIAMLYVLENYRRCGIARMAMRRTLRKTVDLGLLPTVGVEPRNNSSFKLMAELGFEYGYSYDFIYTS